MAPPRESAKKVVPLLVYSVRTSQKSFEVLRIPESQNILTFVLRPRKILKISAHPKENQGITQRSRLHNLAFSLDLPWISRFFVAAGQKSGYFSIQGYVKLQNFFERSLHHKLTLGPLFSHFREVAPHNLD